MIPANVCPSKLHAYLSKVQTEAISLHAMLEGIDILCEEDRGRNAAVALIQIAIEKADGLTRALDSILWPKAVAEG